MKKIILSIAMAFVLTGCAGVLPMGGIFADLKLPMETTGLGSAPHKVGTASCKSYFGMVATGDCSIETAKKDGGITHIHHIDWDIHNIIGIASYQVIVYGD